MRLQRRAEIVERRWSRAGFGREDHMRRPCEQRIVRRRRPVERRARRGMPRRRAASQIGSDEIRKAVVEQHGVDMPPTSASGSAGTRAARCPRRGRSRSCVSPVASSMMQRDRRRRARHAHDAAAVDALARSVCRRCGWLTVVVGVAERRRHSAPCRRAARSRPRHCRRSRR